MFKLGAWRTQPSRTNDASWNPTVTVVVIWPRGVIDPEDITAFSLPVNPALAGGARDRREIERETHTQRVISCFP